MVKLIRLFVHVLVSTAASAWLLGSAGLGSGVEPLNVSFVASLCLNWFIDRFGHRGGLRSPTTHEPINASLASAAIAAFVGALFLYDAGSCVAALVACGVGYLTHLALDLLSGGIYVRNGKSYERVRLARLGRGAYDAANSALLLASLLAVAAYLASNLPRL